MALKKTITRKGRKFILDDTNMKILDELIDNARTSKTAIANKIFVSRISVGERIDELEAAGIIEGYTAVINWDKIDNGGK